MTSELSRNIKLISLLGKMGVIILADVFHISKTLFRVVILSLSGTQLAEHLWDGGCTRWLDGYWLHSSPGNFPIAGIAEENKNPTPGGLFSFC